MERIPEISRQLEEVPEADVQVNALVSYSDSYNRSSVNLGIRRDPREIAQLSMQARLVEVKLPASSHASYVEKGEEEADNNNRKEEVFCDLVKIGEGNFGVVYKGIWKRKLAE